MIKRIGSFLLMLSLLLSLFCGCADFTASNNGDIATKATATKAEIGVGGKDDTNTLPGNETQPLPGGNFQIHFIDVGQADAALVICNGKTMLIDGGNKEDSNLIYSYLKKQNISYLDYVVCTHAHEDHVGGLAGALTAADAGVVFSPVTQYNSKAFSDFVKKANDRGRQLTVPHAGDRFALGGATVTVLGPVKEYEEPNDTSIVLRIVYGETSFLFTGDMESTAEADLLESGATLKSTLLKVGHHGSSTSTSYRFLREVAPKYGVISVGTDNSYGHPTETVLSRLRDADVTLYRTDYCGDVICTSDGKTLSFQIKKGEPMLADPSETTGVSEYACIGNLESKKYHRLDCSTLPKEENRIYFTSVEEAEEKGYTPCGRCKP